MDRAPAGADPPGERDLAEEQRYVHWERTARRWTRVTGEPCRICDAVVSFSDTVHVLLNAREDEGVVDYYICRRCYEEEIAPLFEAAEAAPEG